MQSAECIFCNESSTEIILENQQAKAFMDKAHLVITLGSNGYYSNINSQATVVNINKKRNDFDQRADLNLRGDTDTVMKELMKQLGA